MAPSAWPSHRTAASTSRTPSTTVSGGSGRMASSAPSPETVPPGSAATAARPKGQRCVVPRAWPWHRTAASTSLTQATRASAGWGRMASSAPSPETAPFSSAATAGRPRRQGWVIPSAWPSHRTAACTLLTPATTASAGSGRMASSPLSPETAGSSATAFQQRRQS